MTEFPLNEATGLVKVVEPAYLKTKIVPISPSVVPEYTELMNNYSQIQNDPYNLVVHNEYDVIIEVYDKTDSLIYVTEVRSYIFCIN